MTTTVSERPRERECDVTARVTLPSGAVKLQHPSVHPLDTSSVSTACVLRGPCTEPAEAKCSPGCWDMEQVGRRQGCAGSPLSEALAPAPER